MSDKMREVAIVKALSPLVNEDMDPDMRAAWLSDLARAALTGEQTHD
jgi:hypothetical protein